MYAEGNGVTRDLVAGYMWCNLSAEQGNSLAAGAREAIAKDMTPEEIAQAQKMTHEWKRNK